MSPNGVITTVGVGDGLAGVGPDGSVYPHDGKKPSRLGSPFPGFTASDIYLPSSDGSAIYHFTPTGRQVQNLDAITGVALDTFGYDSAGRLTSVTDDVGNVTTIAHDTNGNPTSITGPYGQVTLLAVNASGYLASVTDPLGQSTRMGYSTDGLLSSVADPRGNTSSMQYDGSGELVLDTDAAAGTIQLSRKELSGAGYGVTATNATGQKAYSQIVPLTDRSTSRAMTDPAGLVTTTSRSTTVTASGPIERVKTRQPDGSTATVQYEPDSRFGMLAPIATIQTAATPAGLTSTTTAARVVTLLDPAHPYAGLASETDTVVVNGRTFVSSYDATTHSITATSAEGRTSTTVLDSLGRVATVESPGLDDVVYAYDSRGRVSTISQGSRTVTYAYDERGNLVSATDALRRVTSFAYDLDGRLIRQTLQDGSVITFRQDADGNLLGLTPPGAAETTFAYDPHNDVMSTTPPSIGTDDDTTRYVYNLAHQITENVLPGATGTVGYAYDTAGRLSRVTTPWGTYASTYSSKTGQLSSLDGPGGFTLGFGYDGGLLTSETTTGPVSGSVGWTYNSNFQVTSESVDRANAVSYAYDTDGLLTQAGSLTVRRDPASGRATGTTLGTVTDSISYDEFGAPSAYTAKAGQTALLQDTYTRDKLGRITTRVETVGGVTTTTAYGYDLVGRLTTVTENGTVTQTYTYDANGNRLTLTTPGPFPNSADLTATGTYNAQDQLVTYDEPVTGRTEYTYSADGSLVSATVGKTTDTTTAQTTLYSYDGFGNLKQVTLPDGRVITYRIDAENRRVGKAVNGTFAQGLLYDGQLTPVATTDATGAVVERFVYASGGNVPAYMIKAGVTYRLVTDERGSVRLVVNVTTGAVVQRLDYDSFGRVTRDTNPGFQPFGYAGGLYDADTGLVRFGARDYDAATGRWTTKDPIGVAGGTNLYTYTSNDPIQSIDPAGTDDEGDWGSSFSVGDEGWSGGTSVVDDSVWSDGMNESADLTGSLDNQAQAPASGDWEGFVDVGFTLVGFNPLLPLALLGYGLHGGVSLDFTHPLSSGLYVSGSGLAGLDIAGGVSLGFVRNGVEGVNGVVNVDVGEAGGSLYLNQDGSINGISGGLRGGGVGASAGVSVTKKFYTLGDLLNQAGNFVDALFGVSDAS